LISFNPNVRIVRIDGVYSEGDALRLSIYFNTQHEIILTKSALDIFFMLNGFFTASDITSSNFRHKDIDSSEIIDAMLNYGLITDFETGVGNSDRFIVAKSKLHEYTVHFRQISNVNTMIAMLLQKLQVRCVFYNDDVISPECASRNIYFDRSDAGRYISSVLKDRLGASNISFENTFNESYLFGDLHILVSSDSLNWIDSDRHIVINTWSYANTQFNDFSLFNKKDIDISDGLKFMVEGYISAVRSIDDMVYQINSGSVV
jgi:hypothetical protein